MATERGASSGVRSPKEGVRGPSNSLPSLPSRLAPLAEGARTFRPVLAFGSLLIEVACIGDKRRRARGAQSIEPDRGSDRGRRAIADHLSQLLCRGHQLLAGHDLVDNRLLQTLLRGQSPI